MGEGMVTFIHDEFTRKAVRTAQEGKSFFITGKAGTGKTMLLKEICRELEGTKKVAICAPTGVAARNAGGMTIHSLLGLPISIYIPGHKMAGLYRLGAEERELIRSLDVLIVDEVSMVRCDVMDMMNDVLQHYRGNKKPFGGLQVILFGDLCQLMPVAPEEDWDKLGKYYKSPYFFSSNVIMTTKMPMLELSKVHRQSDVNFLALLNDVRDGILTDAEERLLQRRYKKDFDPGDAQHYIRLTTHVYKARKYNETKLAEMRGKVYKYAAYKEGIFPKEDWPNDYFLSFKVGARVMFIANDNQYKQYVNGTLGTIVYLSDDEITVRTDEGTTVEVRKTSWDFYQYRINKAKKEVEREPLGTFRQYPLKLAWAVTIHKSQGLTFDKVVIDAGKAFTAGQVYVALSRCRTLEGIVLTSRITPEIVKTDPLVIEYTQLVEHIWPDEERPKQQTGGSIEDFITRYGYKPIGHVFKAKWDGKYYDAWDASYYFYLERLEVVDGAVKRLCVGEYPSNKAPFRVLALRQYDKITSFEYLGGSSSVMTITEGGTTTMYNYNGNVVNDRASCKKGGNAVFDRPVQIRTYDFTRMGVKLRIMKHSVSHSSPSNIDVVSDMGILLLCCDSFRILRNDSHTYDVDVDGVVVQYFLDGKALTSEGKMIADKWYQKNQDRANIKKSYEEIPTTRKEPKRPTAAKPKPSAYPPSSLEDKILRCLSRHGSLKAADLAHYIGCTRKEVNSLLYGELSQKGLVKQAGSYHWKLANQD